MEGKRGLAVVGGVCALVLLFPAIILARPFKVNVRSAILLDVSNGQVLYEQNADSLIPPASITKILSLYLVFDAMREGLVHPSDVVPISSYAASIPPSRMGLITGRSVTLEELVKGMAVVSGNDACVAVAEYMAGSVDNFVAHMNAKAHELGMDNTVFKTPNGLPAKGQVTTARDIAKLSVAYLKRFPEALNIHSMRCYTYNNVTHRNANRLLGTCPGVDGIKTGFVCASGYNLSVTAKRGDVRLLAVLLGAPSPSIRAKEATRLLEAGFQAVGAGTPDIRLVQDTTPGDSSKTTCGVGRSSEGEDTCRVKPRVKTARKSHASKHVARTRVARESGVGDRAEVVRPSHRSGKSAAGGSVKAASAGAKHGKGVQTAKSSQPAQKLASVKIEKPVVRTTAAISHAAAGKTKDKAALKAENTSGKAKETKKVKTSAPKAAESPAAKKSSSDTAKTHPDASSKKTKK